MKGHSSPGGLKIVALFEASKGLIVLLVGLGLASLIHKDVGAAADYLVRHAHLNPASRYPQIFLDAAARLDDTRLLTLALLTALYSAVRLAEAYGLWHGRAWAEWLGAVSGGIYVPFELVHFLHRPGIGRATLFLGNIAIVMFLVRELWLRRQARASIPAR
jgi:uncharacterized membrane protein (DUF2068 family)